MNTKKLLTRLSLSLLALALSGCAVSSQIDGSESRPAVIMNSPAPVLTPTDLSQGSVNSTRNEVNGIGVGSTYKEVIQRFGKPRSEMIGGENPCGSAKAVLRYKGISFTMDDDGEQNIVVYIEITSSHWEISPGIRTGFNIEDVRSRMGQQGDATLIEEGIGKLGYADGDGYMNFYFENGKVFKISRQLNLC